MQENIKAIKEQWAKVDEHITIATPQHPQSHFVYRAKADIETLLGYIDHLEAKIALQRLRNLDDFIDKINDEGPLELKVRVHNLEVKLDAFIGLMGYRFVHEKEKNKIANCGFEKVVQNE